MASALSSGRRQLYGDEASTCNVTGKKACTLKRFHLFFPARIQTDLHGHGAADALHDLVSAARVKSLAPSSVVQSKAMQCKSVGNQLLETIIDVARNASTLRPIFAPREIRARLCKILQRCSRTTTMPTCRDYQHMLEK